MLAVLAVLAKEPSHGDTGGASVLRTIGLRKEYGREAGLVRGQPG